MPAGELTTRPLPTEPALPITDRKFGTKVAVTVRGTSIAVWQVESAQSPPNARKTDVTPGCVCNDTRVPAVNRAVHVPLTAPALNAQSMPAGIDTTRPLPVPLPDTDNATLCIDGPVIGAGDDPLPPEQAESALAATAADRSCRAVTAPRKRGVAVWMGIAGRKGAS